MKRLQCVENINRYHSTEPFQYGALNCSNLDRNKGTLYYNHYIHIMTNIPMSAFCPYFMVEPAAVVRSYLIIQNHLINQKTELCVAPTSDKILNI